jgi:hypothetical protein
VTRKKVLYNFVIRLIKMKVDKLREENHPEHKIIEEKFNKLSNSWTDLSSQVPPLRHLFCLSSTLLLLNKLECFVFVVVPPAK